MIDHNENRPGYKKTKVGWLPEEWKVRRLGSITKFSQYGLSLNSEDKGLTPLLRMGNIENGKVTYKNLTYVNGVDDECKYLVKANDLLFNRTNSLEHVGKLGIVTESKKAVFASYLVRFKIDESLALPTFVTYLFNTTESRNRLKKMATPGVCQYNINQSELQRHFVIQLPSLNEQKRIAEILSTWEETIE
ncbi:MAG: restriction endonuclease subunit S, partial [Deltaproteobacteria bacterium]|nr:restriction endonuclease subunit S [Deltaproteobacteria bacterium]